MNVGATTTKFLDGFAFHPRAVQVDDPGMGTSVQVSPSSASLLEVHFQLLELSFVNITFKTPLRSSLSAYLKHCMLIVSESLAPESTT